MKIQNENSGILQQTKQLGIKIFWFYKKSKIDCSISMDIIKRYKNEVNKSIDFLKEEGVITEDELEANKQQISRQNQVQKQNQLAQQVNDIPNPYLKKRQQFLKFSPISKCVVCRQPGKYRCPQCLISYCSSSHYKSHNLFCSQQFFKKQVQNQMKSLKASKQQKSKTLEYLKQHNELRGKAEEAELKQFSEERLMKILEMIQSYEAEGKQITADKLGLTVDQEQKLKQYIQNMKIHGSTNTQQQPTSSTQTQTQANSSLQLQFNQPYWLIPDGLDFYFMQQLQIQQFVDSKHPQLICYRQLASKKYRSEIKQLHELLNNKIKLSQLFYQQILQFMIIFTVINLTYNNDLYDPQTQQQIFKTFQSLYVQDLCKLLKQSNISTQQKAGEYTLAKIKENIYNVQDKEIGKIMMQWYRIQAIKGCKIIVKNKYLMIQTFLRLLDLFQRKYRKISEMYEEVKKVTDKSSQKQSKPSNDLKSSKQLKRSLNQMTKHIKKIQLILSYIKNQMSQSKSFSKDSQTKQLEINLQKNNLFRALYRILINEDDKMTKQNQDSKFTKKDIEQLQNMQKNGNILIPK